jgi:hypothetical protein
LFVLSPYYLDSFFVSCNYVLLLIELIYKQSTPHYDAHYLPQQPPPALGRVGAFGVVVVAGEAQQLGASAEPVAAVCEVPQQLGAAAGTELELVILLACITLAELSATTVNVPVSPPNVAS